MTGPIVNRAPHNTRPAIANPVTAPSLKCSGPQINQPTRRAAPLAQAGNIQGMMFRARKT